MGDRPESDGTIWTPPKSAGDLKREYERERTDDPACSDPTCSYRAELVFQRERLDHWRDRAIAAEGRLSEDALRERPPLAEYQRGYRNGHWEGMQECGRPPLTEEEAEAVVDFLGEREAQDFDGWNGAAKRLLYSAAGKLRALASSTTEERYEAAERLRRRQDDPRTQERSLSAWREEEAPDDCRYGLCPPDCNHGGSRGEGRTDPQRRWTLVNEGEHDFAHLSYDGPPIKVGERVEVVPANDQLTVEEAEALLYSVDVPVGSKDSRLLAKLRRLAGRED